MFLSHTYYHYNFSNTRLSYIFASLLFIILTKCGSAFIFSAIARDEDDDLLSLLRFGMHIRLFISPCRIFIGPAAVGFTIRRRTLLAGAGMTSALPKRISSSGPQKARLPLPMGHHHMQAASKKMR